MKLFVLNLIVTALLSMFCQTANAKDDVSDIVQYRYNIKVCVADEDRDSNFQLQLEHIYQQIDCLRGIYYKIVDDFYSENAETLKHNFDKYLQSLYDINGEVYFPDFIRNENVGQLFVLKTKIDVRDDVVSMINRYIDGLAYWEDNFSIDELDKK